MSFRFVFPGVAALAVGFAACDGGAGRGGSGAPGSSGSAQAPSTTSAPEPNDAGADADAADASDDDGGDAGDAGDGGDGGAPEPTCPDDMIHPGRYYCVDRYEAHLVVIGPDGAITPHPHYEVPETDVTYWARSEKDTYPQAYINRTTAQAACKASGKRLCSREEWMRACRGPKGWTFPYGNKRKTDRCNQSKPHLLQEMFGSNPSKWSYNDAFNSPRLDQEPGYLAVTGFFPECMTAEGAFDMVGNLHEWVSDTVDDDIQDILAKDKVDRNGQPYRTGNGIFMGGFFSTTDQHGPGCFFTTIAHEPKYHDYSTGFRCCKSLPRPPKEKKVKKKKG